MSDAPKVDRVSFERARPANTRADQTTVRRANLGVVLQHIARECPRSRARIAAETGLTRGTVSSLVAELIDLELLRETGEDERPGGVGRPAQTLELDDRIVAIGLEVNVDYLAVCVEDVRGVIRCERRVMRDNRRSTPAPVIARLATMAATALRVAEDEQGLRVSGIAVAVPGLVEVASGTLLRAPNLGWSEVGISDALRARLETSLPISVENEANLAALAEHWRGAAQGLRSFVCVFGEVGVGGGIFVDGELFRGNRGFGGEIGHMTIDPNGARCACGARGCLETFVGQEAIARRAGIVAPEDGRTRSVTDEIVRRAAAGDPSTLEALDEAGTLLGTALASTVNLLDLDGVVLGGCFGPLAPWLVDRVSGALEEHLLASPWFVCEVRASTFGEGAAVRGAAALTLLSVLASPWTVGDRQGAVQRVAS